MSAFLLKEPNQLNHFHSLPIIQSFSVACLTSGDIWKLYMGICCCCSVTELWLLGLLHTRLFCPSPSPEACSNSGPLNQLCHPIISSSVIPFSYCLQSYPASRSFLMIWLFSSGDRSIGASVLASVLPRDSQESSLTPQFKSINSLGLSFLCAFGLFSIGIGTFWKFSIRRTYGFYIYDFAFTI